MISRSLSAIKINIRSMAAITNATGAFMAEGDCNLTLVHGQLYTMQSQMSLTSAQGNQAICSQEGLSLGHICTGSLNATRLLNIVYYIIKYKITQISDGNIIGKPSFPIL